MREVVRTQSIDEQAETFLHAFAKEFENRFSDIFDLAAQFKSFCKRGEKDLGQVDAHLFLLSRKEAKTAAELINDLKVIDYDHNNRVAFLEYLLFTFKKLPEQLFRAKPIEASKVDLSVFDSAITKHSKAVEFSKVKEKRIAELEEVIKLGGPDAARANVRETAHGEVT